MKALVWQTVFVLGLSLLMCCCGHNEAQAQNKSTSPGAPTRSSTAGVFKVGLTNDLGVTSMIDVREVSAGKDVVGDTYDAITPELNGLGGKWPTETGDGVERSRFTVEINPPKGPARFVLVPWPLFKSLSAQGRDQVVLLKDGTEYRGRLRTILVGTSGSENDTYELAGASSMTILQMPTQLAPTHETSDKATRWTVTEAGMPPVVVSRPRFLYSRYRETRTPPPLVIERSYYEALVTERFGVAPGYSGDEGSHSGTWNVTSAAISDFETVAIGNEGKRTTGLRVSVKARTAPAVTGLFAVSPFGLDPWDNSYLNRSIELAGDLPNGCSIVWSVKDGLLTMTKSDAAN